jgi:uncharacterized protein (DUF2141 family)
MNLILFIIALFFLTARQGGEYTLTVTVSGLTPVKGDLYISIHNRPQYFQEADSAFLKKKITIQSEIETLFFENVPEGNYAVAVYHDENLNGIMEISEKGFPVEGYGFSTKGKIIGRPKFDQAVFEVKSNDTIEIKMIYLKVK